MSVDQATVRRIARLARIKVEEEDVPRLEGELNSILHWIEQLNEVDVERRAADLGRRDEDEDARGRGDRRQLSQDAVMRNAPVSEDEFLHRAEGGRVTRDMNDPTSLTIAAARKALAKRRVQRARTDRCLSRRDGEGAHSQCLYRRDAGTGARPWRRPPIARLAKGEGGALEGIPLGIKDLFATKGVHTQAAATFSTASSRPMNRPSPPICGATAR